LLREPVSALPNSAELQCRFLLDQGQTEFSLSHYPESKRLFDQSLQTREFPSPAILIAEIELRRGAVLARLDDAAEGEADLRDALRLARQSKDTYLEASVLGNWDSYA